MNSVAYKVKLIKVGTFFFLFIVIAADGSFMGRQNPLEYKAKESSPIIHSGSSPLAPEWHNLFVTLLGPLLSLSFYALYYTML